jgi:hypothetical protein
MKLIKLMLACTLCCSPVLPFETAQAQARLPPHVPGGICSTPNLWCWMTPPGKVGSACMCPSPYGQIRGVYS